jgi:hypothetical protein
MYLIYQHHTRLRIDIRTSILKMVVHKYEMDMRKTASFAGKADIDRSLETLDNA